MMVRAKNYETISTFVKVVQKKTLASFFRTRCILCLQNMSCIQGSVANGKRTGTLTYMASTGVRAYNGGLGAVPPVGSTAP